MAGYLPFISFKTRNILKLNQFKMAFKLFGVIMAYTDAEIRRVALDQLAWDNRLGESKLNVTVSNGEVTLFGTVPSYFARESAEADILEVPGVVKVKNQSVIKNGKAGTVTDSEIRARVLNRFLWNPNIGPSNIDVMVDNGSVVIGGSVDAYWKKVRAEEIAYDTDGVTDVHNELAVVPSHQYTDEEIAANIIAAIKRNREVDAGSVEIDVDQGRVTLGGTVSEIRHLYTIFEIARFTRGVRDVVNLIRVYKKAA